MTKVIRTLEHIDVFLLRSILCALTFCTEWFSWTRRGMERGLIAVYAAGQIAIYGSDPASFRHLRVPIWVWVVLVTFICSGMWREQRKGTNERMMKMLTLHWLVGRISLTCIWVATFALTFLPPFHLRDLIIPLSSMAYAIFHYATSLPDKGNRGRRRKAALAKLRSAIGGIGWSTAPQTQGGAA